MGWDPRPPLTRRERRALREARRRTELFRLLRGPWAALLFFAVALAAVVFVAVRFGP